MTQNNNANIERCFEIELVKLMQNNPHSEIAGELLSLYAKHKVEGTEASEELKKYINNFCSNSENKSINDKTFMMIKEIGRPLYEHKHIAMNSYTWRFILSGKKISIAYEETAKIFNTSQDLARQAFERKNHDFGGRELAKIGLGIFLVLNNHPLTSKENKIASNVLGEPLSKQILKDDMHRKNKYKDILNNIL